MACDYLNSTGCDGNAIELRQIEAEHAALVAVAEAAKHVLYVAEDCQTEQPTKQISVSFIDDTLRQAIANLAAVREGGNQ